MMSRQPSAISHQNAEQIVAQMRAVLDHHGMWNSNFPLVPIDLFRRWVEGLESLVLVEDEAG